MSLSFFRFSIYNNGVQRRKKVDDLGKQKTKQILVLGKKEEGGLSVFLALNAIIFGFVLFSRS